MVKQKKIVEIFTDGACRGNPGPGGWGAVLRWDHHVKKILGADEHTTNNRMELLAAINALTTLKKSCEIALMTDSQYLQKGIRDWLPQWKARGWKTSDKKPVKNADLWQRLEQEAGRHQIKWRWVKGHSGHPENDMADALANQAIDELLSDEK